MADRGFSDLLSTASSLLNSQSLSSDPSQGHNSTPSSAEGGHDSSSSSSSHAHKPSYGDVYASAQLVMDAAKNKLHKTDSSATEDISYGKLAGAAGTLIGAATHYGKLDQSGIGKYAHKAQEYLHSYEIKHSKPGMAAPPSQPAAHHDSSGYGQGHPPSTHTSSEVNHSQPSAPPVGYPYPGGYPPQGYPNAQQNYGYGPQGHSKPAESSINVDNYPPVGYPPAGYPTSGGNYNRPTKY